MISQAAVTPQHETLLLKNSTHTILVSQLPTAPISSIKRDLLKALASRGISELPLGTPVPSVEEIEKVQLGLAIDRKDLTKGFKLLRESPLIDGEEGKGKGKAKAVPKSKNSLTNDTVIGAGLRDGDVIAFRFKISDEKSVDGEDFDMMGDLDDDQERTWNVILPSFADEEE